MTEVWVTEGTEARGIWKESCSDQRYRSYFSYKHNLVVYAFLKSPSHPPITHTHSLSLSHTHTHTHTLTQVFSNLVVVADRLLECTLHDKATILLPGLHHNQPLIHHPYNPYNP